MPSLPTPPNASDVYRYRYQHGVNLGGVFVLERWLFASMFDTTCKGDSEIDAVQASLALKGLDSTTAKWERHWQSAVTQDDITLLVRSGVTLVRLPIGHFTLGPSYCAGTPFDGIVAQAHAKAWSYVLDLAKRLHAAGIGILLDLHALPGGANDQSHSGTSGGKVGLWGSTANRALARSCAVFLARELGRIPNCAGIELCNEAAWGAQDLYGFYADCIAAIAEVDASIPVYISDAWNLGDAVAWAAKRNVVAVGDTAKPTSGASKLNPVVVDTHTYYTFSEADRACSPEQILSRIPDELTPQLRQAPAPPPTGSQSSTNPPGGPPEASDGLARGTAPVFIGEYSCVLDGRTWARVAPADRDGLVRRLGRAQTARAERQCLGAAFWTLKMDWMDGGEWGFVEMTKRGAISAPAWKQLAEAEAKTRISKAAAARQGARPQALKAFRERCAQDAGAHTGGSDERFEAGFELGWADALVFFESRDRIGSRDLWVLKRLRDVGPGVGVWEWEQGLRCGLQDAERCFLSVS